MTDEQNPTTRPAVSADAKVEATAKLSYSVEKKVTENVPEDVTRAKSGAWLDLISPLTEWAGLTGDALRYKRDLLRLHREETLREIGRKFAARQRPRRVDAEPIPLKFMVPYLEQASLEELDSPLVDMWANLLVPAAENYDPTFIYFSSIIARMTARQAALFDAIMKNLGELEDIGGGEIEIPQDAYRTFHARRLTEGALIRNHLTSVNMQELRSTFRLAETLLEFSSRNACIFRSVIVSDIDKRRIMYPFSEFNWPQGEEIDCQILQTLGLLLYDMGGVYNGDILILSFRCTIQRSWR